MDLTPNHSTFVQDIPVLSALVGDKRVISGRDGVTEIIYHTPKGDGDRHFVDVCCGRWIYRCFDVIEVQWIED